MIKSRDSELAASCLRNLLFFLAIKSNPTIRIMIMKRNKEANPEIEIQLSCPLGVKNALLNKVSKDDGEEPFLWTPFECPL